MKKVLLIILTLSLILVLSSTVFAIDTKVKVEAESGTLSGGADVQTGNNASGDSFIGLKPLEAGTASNAKFTLNVAEAGSYEFIFTYSAKTGSAQRKADVLVNGQRHNLNIQFTTEWDVWSTTSITCDLNKGENVIELCSSNDFDGETVKTPNIDYFTYDLKASAVTQQPTTAQTTAQTTAPTADPTDETSTTGKSDGNTDTPNTADPISVLTIALMAASAFGLYKTKK